LQAIDLRWGVRDEQAGCCAFTGYPAQHVRSSCDLPPDSERHSLRARRAPMLGSGTSKIERSRPTMETTARHCAHDAGISFRRLFSARLPKEFRVNREFLILISNRTWHKVAMSINLALLAR
jgi:hypothetical protein